MDQPGDKVDRGGQNYNPEQVGQHGLTQRGPTDVTFLQDGVIPMVNAR
jgi:hypothetical protein